MRDLAFDILRMGRIAVIYSAAKKEASDPVDKQVSGISKASHDYKPNIGATTNMRSVAA